MSSGEANSSVTPKSALDALKEWKELIAFVALTLSSVISGLIGRDHPKVQVISWILAVVFVSASAYAIHRINKRKREQERREKLRAERDAIANPQSAFRGLASFEERDELPGKDRRLEARSIATRIASDGFRFGVICGDSGCGKSSLLRTEVTSSLKKMGFEVNYVRSPRQDDRKSSDAIPIESFTREYQALLRNFVKRPNTVLIIDQFEEWLIEHQDPEVRQEIGHALRKLSERSSKVLCAIRREFLIDFHEIADELPQQLSSANLFHTKNFTTEQAIDVITECATFEGIALDDSFAAVVAHDLSEADQVRPPELQIVCTQLAGRGGLSTQKYREAGGTAAILSHHIQEALDAAKERAMAARLLRAVCDFPAHAKRKPQTISQLSIAISDGGIAGNTHSTVESAADQFVASKILLRDKKDNTYALLHDYLVDAIQLATADASTKTEEANQLLRYYVKEARGTIPYQKLRFIKAFAERPYREEPVARALIRRSSISPYIRWGPLSLAILLTIIYGSAAIRSEWDRSLVGSHRDIRGQEVSVVSADLHSVGLFATLSNNDVIVWDSRTAIALSRFFKGDVDTAVWSPSGKYLLIGRGVGTGHRLIEVSTGKEKELLSFGKRCSFDDSEKWLTCRDGDRIVIYSIDKDLVLGAFDNVVDVRFAGLVDRCVLIRKKGERYNVEIREISSGKFIGKVLDENFTGTLGSIDIDSAGLKVCQVVHMAEKTTVRLWSLIDGSIVGQSNEFLLNTWSRPNVSFIAHGSAVVVYEDGVVGGRFDTGPQMNWSGVPADRRWSPFFFIPDRDGASSWKIPNLSSLAILDRTRREPLIINGLRAGTDQRLLLGARSDRAIVWDQDRVQLWDLSGDKLVAGLNARRVISVRFTLEDTAALLEHPDGTFSLFDAVDGSPIVLEQPTGGALAIYYDRNCRRYNVWNKSGEIVRYTKRRAWGLLSSNVCN